MLTEYIHNKQPFLHQFNSTVYFQKISFLASKIFIYYTLVTYYSWAQTGKIASGDKTFIWIVKEQIVIELLTQKQPGHHKLFV